MVLESREAILALAPILESLAARCQQAGAMHWLRYFLEPAVLGRRVPRLVLFLEPEEDGSKGLASTDLRAAALFFEYKILGIGTGIVATGDAVGFNSVIAPPGQRAGVAAAASRILIERGALVVLTTYESTHEVEDELSSLGLAGVRWANRQRSVRRLLFLKRSMEETLASMGKATRFNLRYYRRRLEKQMPCRYIADAAPVLRGVDLQSLNASSLNPVEPEEFARRVAAATELTGSFLSGLEGPSGQWLSLIGGWRQGSTTVLYWQMNASGFEKHSIGTVMRSHFLQAEIDRGAQKLLIFGGTPHSMRHAFAEDAVADLVVERTGVRARLLRAVANTVYASGLLGRSNFVAETLCSETLAWKTAASVSTEGRSVVVKSLPAGRAA